MVTNDSVIAQAPAAVTSRAGTTALKSVNILLEHM